MGAGSIGRIASQLQDSLTDEAGGME